MLLIAEIILTILAWRKGWRWLAIIPVGIAVLIGMILGFSGGALEGAFVFDILAIIALIVMWSKPPKTEKPLN